MSKLITALPFFAALSCNAQTGDFNNEFKTYNNGLIYSDATMNQLTHIVDSLNLKFKRCDMTRAYYAISQGIGNHVSLEKANIKEALADINRNISFDDFVKKYTTAEVDYRMLILKSRYKDTYDKKWVVEFSGQTLKDYGELKIRKGDLPEYAINPLKGKWITRHDKKSAYSEEGLEAFYITEEFTSLRIPEKYARMILYSDCVIDTTVDIFTEKAKNSGVRYYSEDKDYKKTKLHAFNNYVEQSTKHITEKDVPASYKEYKWFALDSMKEAWINQNLVNTEKFKQLLTDALKEAKEKNTSTTDKFEKYVAMYVSKADALEMKRNRRVIGGCSMDQSPRYHALNIAMLSAETVNWQVFLRAHLNIMNDRFDRMSDGSYAWAGRNTYIKELEELNIEVQELLLGISFRIENPVEKHYYGSIGRLGRALAETKNRVQLEEQLLNMIKDTQLDAYNRILIHYLYLNYIYYLPKKETRLESLTKLEEADKTLPDFLKSRIKIKKESFERDN
ncbi:MAG: hypothetical protein JNM14_13955 [Ferruginibacter sp.]|nr:hypothetical protein [Ferruginibacter sp.]